MKMTGGLENKSRMFKIMRRGLLKWMHIGLQFDKRWFKIDVQYCLDSEWRLYYEN